MGLFSSNKSKSTTVNRVVGSDAAVDALISDSAKQFNVQGVNLEGSTLTFEDTSQEALQIAKNALVGSERVGLSAINRAGALTARGIDRVGDLTELSIERNAGLLNDVGGLLAAGFEGVFDFADATQASSQQLALSLARPDALETKAAASSRNATSLALLILIAGGAFLALRS